ncbi:hypothetical protein LA080_001532 [Diaporthe eres]|nr:hypothetical protein LA080_001532 [Diaporthe eres]
MKSGLLFQFMWCGLSAHGNARSVGNYEPSDADLVVADDHSAAMNATSNSVMLEEMKVPDCELLKYPVDDHPTWNFGKIKKDLQVHYPVMIPSQDPLVFSVPNSSSSIPIPTIGSPVKTASLASCECGHSWALLKCSVTIPNDHIFDERNIAIDPDRCGRSVYDAVPRGWSAKSRPRCELDKDNVAHLTWNNGIGTNLKHIKKGFDQGLCGHFKNVQCVKV